MNASRMSHVHIYSDARLSLGAGVRMTPTTENASSRSGGGEGMSGGGGGRETRGGAGRAPYTYAQQYREP
jgi:hypothetical protein